MAARIGIDTGGTFTDVVRWSPRGVRVHKLPSTPDDPARAVLAGLAAVRTRADEPVDLVHGTTVGLNAVLTGALARTVFVTNRGFEDLIEIGRQDRDDLYAFAPHRSVPPVPRRLRVGVDCRRDATGVVTPLTAAAVQRTVAAVRRLRPAAIAIGLLHAPADPRDERRLARALAAALPDVPITCSAELLPSFGEYERFSAAILNAAIAPVVGRYTQRLQQDLGPGRLRLLRSSLGVLPAAEAAQFPARAMFSGPAGGVLATTQLLRRLGARHAAAFDMGGTSADVCLCGDEASADTGDGAIAGLPLPLPSVPVHTVGCGGGSIAYADAGGALRIGPHSAGADPGPACYGKGDEPTVTDAHLVLGHLGADTLLGGAFPVDVDAAVRAVERLARRLGMSLAATARGIVEIADATMARAILVITAERAVDPAAVPLVAYGGAGGLHAAGLIERLGMPRAVLPPHAGAFSALGLALAGESVELGEAVRLRADGAGLHRLTALGRELQRRAAAALEVPTRSRVEVLVRYAGQGAALRLPLAPDLPRRFAREHQRRYGFVADAPIEVVRVVARAETQPRPFPLPPAPSRGNQGHAAVRRRPIGGSVRVLRRDLDTIATCDGPLAVEETTATTWVPAGFAVRTSPYGLELCPKRQRRRRTSS
ncbi:MAG: hydantoinase/oxoprolinase family protein [Planctomycetes bacterium]|nr:hydantoinase/oxoprolinase family protein [Planctomycetota bacterium]